MDRVPQKVLGWLHSVLQNGYQDANRTYYDIGNALGRYSSLRPSTEVYTFDNGNSALLLHLTGTIQHQFRGTTYSSPVSVWIPYEYPRWPPICYVTASQGMSIRPNQYVGVDGRIFHPYARDQWNPHRSSLSELLDLISQAFSHEPPLVSRQSAPPLPPLPASSSRSASLDQRQHATSPRHALAPALPPKPTQETQQRVQSPPSNPAVPPPRPPKPGDGAAPIQYSQPQHQHRPFSVASQPPPPPQPLFLPQYGAQIPQNQAHWQSHTPQWQPQPQQPVPAAQQQQQQPRPQLAAPQQQQPPRQALQPGQPQYQPAYQQPTSTQPPPSARTPQQWPGQPTQTAPVRKAPVPQDLLTSPFDVPLPDSSNLPVPPVPPNPEKDALLHAISQSLNAQLDQILQSNASALPALQAQHTALQSALSSLQQEFAHLRALEAQVKANESLLHASLEEADKAISDAKQRPVPNIDETLIAPTVLSKQVYDLVAEEKSCIAAREVLGKGLDRGRLGAEQWVKSVRGVAREEWLKKWLIRRAALGMGLQGVSPALPVDDGEEKEVAGTYGDDAFYRS